MTGTAKKNASDLRTFERLLKKANFSVQTYDEWALLDKIDQGRAIVAAIEVAEKTTGEPYPNDWAVLGGTMLFRSKSSIQLLIFIEFKKLVPKCLSRFLILYLSSFLVRAFLRWLVLDEIH